MRGPSGRSDADVVSGQERPLQPPSRTTRKQDLGFARWHFESIVAIVTQ